MRMASSRPRACGAARGASGGAISAAAGVFAVAAALCVAFALIPLPAYSDTIILEGHLDSELRISKEMRWTVDRPLSELTVELAVPPSFSNRVLRQKVSNVKFDIKPKPARVSDEQDHLGNLRRKVTWYNLKTDPEIKIVFDARVEATLAKMESRVSFPLKAVGAAERQYLKGTPLVQVDSPEVQALSRELAGNATTEFQVVTAVINYVADNIRYVFNPMNYDAVSTLRDRSGNCSNSAHLSAALLRAAGIPARVVGGTTLDKQLKVPMDGVRSLVQTMGKGGHAWIEVYFPDLGWLSYDPKQSKQFTSTRHVKESHGTDTSEIAESWTGIPYAPAFTSIIDARFLKDAVKVHPVLMQDAPKSYVMSNDLKAFAGLPEMPTGVTSAGPPEGQGAEAGAAAGSTGAAGATAGSAGHAPGIQKPPVTPPTVAKPVCRRSRRDLFAKAARHSAAAAGTGSRGRPCRGADAARGAAQAARDTACCAAKAACRAPAVGAEGSSLRQHGVSEPRCNVQHLRRKGVEAARRGDCRVRHIDLRLCTGVYHRRAHARTRRGTGYA